MQSLNELNKSKEEVGRASKSADELSKCYLIDDVYLSRFLHYKTL